MKLQMTTIPQALADHLYESYLLGEMPGEGAVISRGAALLFTGDVPDIKKCPPLEGFSLPVYGADTPRARLAAKSFLEWRRLPAGMTAALTKDGLLVTEDDLTAPDAEDYKSPDALAEILTAGEAAECYGKKVKDVTADCEAGAFPKESVMHSAGTWLLTRTAADKKYGKGKEEMTPHPFLLAFPTAEAALLWGRDPGTVRAAAAGAGHAAARLRDGERRRAGRIWLVTRSAMEMLYGQIRGEAWQEWTKKFRKR